MRINLWGGPGSGKSTLASKIFVYLKSEDYNIELVLEYIKKWTYINRLPGGFDQYYISAKQLHGEYTVLQSGFDHIVTDCPVMLNCFYADYCDLPFTNSLIDIALEFEKQYPSLNILLLRKKYIHHSNIARFHDESESKKIDNEIVGFLDKNKICYYKWDSEKPFEDHLFFLKKELENNNGT